MCQPGDPFRLALHQRCCRYDVTEGIGCEHRQVVVVYRVMRFEPLGYRIGVEAPGTADAGCQAGHAVSVLVEELVELACNGGRRFFQQRGSAFFALICRSGRQHQRQRAGRDQREQRQPDCYVPV